MFFEYIKRNKFHTILILITSVAVIEMCDSVKQAAIFIAGFWSAFYIEAHDCKVIKGRLAANMFGLLSELIILLIFIFNYISAL